MYKLLFLFISFINTQTIFAQQQKVNSLLQKLSAEKVDSTRFIMLENFLQITSESDPLLDMHNLQRIYLYGQKKP